MDTIILYVHSLHQASSVMSINYKRCPIYHPWITTAVQSLSRVYKLRPIWGPYITSPGFSSPSFTTQSPVIAQNSPLIAQNCPNSSMFLASNRPTVQVQVLQVPNLTPKIKPATTVKGVQQDEGEWGVRKFSKNFVFKINKWNKQLAIKCRNYRMNVTNL